MYYKIRLSISLVFTLAVLTFGSLAKASLPLDAPPQTQVLFDLDSDWKLWGKDRGPHGEWSANRYDDSAWEEAPGVVGHFPHEQFPEGQTGTIARTLLEPGRETVYLRSQFDFDGNVDDRTRLILDYYVRDGAVIFLNGVEIGRTAQMPKEGNITHSSRAMVRGQHNVQSGFYIDPTLLRQGRNSIALSLHSYDNEDSNFIRFAALRLTLINGWDTRPHTTIPKHQRVMWLENPQSEAMVSWTTSAKSRENVLFYDTEPRRGRLQSYAHRQPADHSGEFAMIRQDVDFGTRPGHYYHVHLQNLAPDTTYYMTMVSDNEASREFNFRTAPADDRPIKLLFGGDSRIGGHRPYFHHDRRGINRRMVALAEAQPDILAFVHGGDFTQRAHWRYFRPWLTDHELTITQDGRIIPILVTRGNHDMDFGFEEVFWWPGQANKYYFHTQFTPQISIIFLNSEISHGGVQRRFLRDTLETVRPEQRWVLASYHRPAWPSVRGFETSADRRRFWVPLFDDYKIDLGLESHDHALKRTVPILYGEQHPDGVIYIGDGGLGVPQRNPDPSRWYLQEPGITDSAHHVHVLEFSTAQITGTAYGMGGEILDHFTIPVRDPENDFARVQPEPAEVIIEN